MDWKLDLLTGLSEHRPGPGDSGRVATADRTGPDLRLRWRAIELIDDSGRSDAHRIRVIRVSSLRAGALPDQIRVHLETRSAALATIYQAALRSDRVAFVSADAPASEVDVVLVDSAGMGGKPILDGLRNRFPEAVFVSLGVPEAPHLFDEVVEQPKDVGRLKTRMMGKRAS